MVVLRKKTNPNRNALQSVMQSNTNQNKVVCFLPSYIPATSFHIYFASNSEYIFSCLELGQILTGHNHHSDKFTIKILKLEKGEFPQVSLPS